MEFTVLLKNGNKKLINTANLTTLAEEVGIKNIYLWIKGNEIDLYNFINNKWIFDETKINGIILNKYIEDVKSQLNCNAINEYKNNYITYLYTNEQIESNLDYFKKCYENGLSPYKSLLFFNEFLLDLS